MSDPKPKNRLQDILLSQKGPTIDQMIQRQRKEAEETMVDCSQEFLAQFESSLDRISEGYNVDNGPVLMSLQKLREAGRYFAQCSL
jgi:hypothetical protein